MQDSLESLVERNKTQAADNFCSLLEKYQVNYTEAGLYYLVGEPAAVQGWILHVSVIKVQITSLLKAVLPILAKSNIPFKVASSFGTAENLMSGAAGYQMLGKIIEIYPTSDTDALKIAKQLIALTEHFNGPAIPTDRHLGSCVHTRYGGIKPIVFANEDGIIEELIYDSKGHLIKDEYAVPFRLPEGISWPFEEIGAVHAVSTGKMINKSYLPVQSLKSDVKGEVIKALDVRRWLWVKWCVIKTGKRFMCADYNSRTIEDRLLWQKELQAKLSDDINVPKVLDYFEWNGDTNFVMEYIGGTPLINLVHEAFRGRAWFDLSLNDKVFLLDNFWAVVEQIARLHHKGYIHRDIMPHNFIRDKKGRVYCIDIELCYSLIEKKPFPPFALGTHGYMSPEQAVIAMPTYAQDIYSLGALMALFFTSISPVHFDTTDNVRLYSNLYFYIRDKDIAALIASCLNTDPTMRPSLNVLQNKLIIYRQQVTNGQNSATYENVTGEESSLVLVQRFLSGLAGDKYTNSTGIWQSRIKHDGAVQNEITALTTQLGLREGIAGILYCIAQARLAGYEADCCSAIYNRNLQFLTGRLKTDLPNSLPGLFRGAAGIALALLAGCKSKLIKDNEQINTLVLECLKLPNAGLDLASGITGLGIVQLNYLKFIYDDTIRQSLSNIVDILLNTQLKDGSWLLTRKGINEAGVKVYGFCYGVSGILYFLLEYARKYNDPTVLAHVERGLHWLEGQAIKKKGKVMWGLNPRNKTIIPWLEEGYSGTCLTFIKAYELLGTHQYRKLAEDALGNHPEHIISNFQNLSNGIAGIGQVYLEAAQVFQNDKWQIRAKWIANALLNRYLEKNGDPFWLHDNSVIPTAEFMNGNTGMLHFLIRYEHPEKIGFPLIS